MFLAIIDMFLILFKEQKGENMSILQHYKVSEMLDEAQFRASEAIEDLENFLDYLDEDRTSDFERIAAYSEIERIISILKNI